MQAAPLAGHSSTSKPYPPTRCFGSERSSNGIADLAFDNVLTSPRTSNLLEQHASAAATMADPRKSSSERLAALSELAGALRPPHEYVLPLLDIPSHHALFDAMAQRAQNLQAGNYVGRNDTACGLLVAGRGAGTTNVMRAFTYGCAAAYPDVIPLYLTAVGMYSFACVFDLAGLMVAAARSHGVDVAADASTDALTDALTKAGKGMLFMVDRIEELYAVGGEGSPWHTNVSKTLATLQWLGEQTSGRFSVLVAGSKEVTSRLVYGAKVPQYVMDRYVVLQSKAGVPDLKQCRVIDIPSALCTDSAQVQRITDQLQVWPDADAEQRRRRSRILTFFAGTTPHCVSWALLPSHLGSVSAYSLAEVVNRKLSNVPFYSHSDDIVLFIELMLLLVKENQELVGRLRSADGTPNLAALTTDEADPRNNWEATLKPLKWAAVEQAWYQLAERRGWPIERRAEHLSMLMDRLVDDRMVTVRPGADTGDMAVWPASMAQVFYSHNYKMDEKCFEEAARELQR